MLFAHLELFSQLTMPLPRHVKTFKIGRQSVLHFRLPLVLCMDCGFQGTKYWKILEHASMLLYTHVEPRVLFTRTTASPFSPSAPYPALRPHPNSTSLMKPFLEHSSILSFPFNFPWSFICDSPMTHNFLLQFVPTSYFSYRTVDFLS